MVLAFGCSALGLCLWTISHSPELFFQSCSNEAYRGKITDTKQLTFPWWIKMFARSGSIPAATSVCFYPTWGWRQRQEIRTGNKHICCWKSCPIKLWLVWGLGGTRSHFRNHRELKEWSAKPKLELSYWACLDDREIQKPTSQMCVPVKDVLSLSLRHHSDHCVFDSRLSESTGVERQLYV